MERLSTLDAGFYFVEHGNVPMHIGSVTVFEGPPPLYPDLVRLFAAKLPLVPRYRQVVRTSPLQVFRPMWADDAHFEIGYHIRHTAVPAPGGPEQLRALAARIFAQRLDRSRPLWEEWLVEGLAGDRWAIISKIHHCMVDGVGGNDLMTLVFDTGPEVRPAEPVSWVPAPDPSAASLLTDGLRDALTWPIRSLITAPALVRRFAAPGFGSGLVSSARRLTAPSASLLNGPIGPHRRWAWATVSLSEVKKARAAHGGTVNDVLLAATTSAFRDLLAGRGQLAGTLVVRTLVPVSVRAPDERGIVTNRISAVLANLPVSEPDPVRRLELIREQMDSLKDTHQAAGAEILTGMLGFAAPMWLALGTRAAFRMGQPLVQTVTTNVPGPRFPLYILGRRMTEILPYVPIGDGVRISTAILSYLDTVSFGVTAEHHAVPDLGVLIDGIGRGVAELAGPPAGAPSPPAHDQPAAAVDQPAAAVPAAGLPAKAPRASRGKPAPERASRKKAHPADRPVPARRKK